MAVTAPTGLSTSASGYTAVRLLWTNGQYYETIAIARSVSGGAYATIATLDGSAVTYLDTTCQDGISYAYKVRGYVAEFGYSNYSSASTTVTPLTPPTGLHGSSSGTQVVLTWTDNSTNEASFKVYMDGVLIETTGVNVQTYTKTGLTLGHTYQFKVQAYNAAAGLSTSSNIINILVGNTPSKPTDLTCTATATTKIRLNWTDASGNEADFHIEQSSTSASAGFAEITTVTQNITTYEVTSLTTNTQYWFRVRAHNASGYSAYCTVATAVTFAAIAAPTTLVCVAVSDTVVDIYFDDNSSEEDYHCVERKDVGAYAEIVQLSPNQNAYRDTGLTASTVYTYKVRAQQGVSYSGYCAEVAVTTLSVPGKLTSAALVTYQDTWTKWSWYGPGTETGFKIERSDAGAGYAEIAVISRGVDDIVPGTTKTYYEYTDKGLTAGVLYAYKARAYNGAGDGSYETIGSQTTRASYSFSKFQRLIRKSNPVVVYLVEINPLIALEAWSLTATKTYTYECTFDERGSEIDAIYENGVLLVNQPDNDTEGSPGTWYHNAATNKVYIHTTGGDTPLNYTITASFWMYATNWHKAGSETVYNGHCYLPLLTEDGIPDITQEAQRYFGGNFIITSGRMALINGEINGSYYFDSKFGRYLFLNRKVKILGGGEGFTYAQFEAINTGIINSYTCTDQRLVLELRDYRENINRDLPISIYTTDEFVNMDESAQFRPKPFGYGVITNAVPICIDTTNRIFEFHAGRIKSVELVTLNGVTLTGGTDYYIDYQRGRIILSAALTYVSTDIVLVNFTGAVNSADEAIATGGAIFNHIMNNFLNITNADLNMDSIWATTLAKTTALSLYMWKDINSQEVIRRIERSIEADTYQDATGKLGIKVRLTSAPSDVYYIPDARILSFGMSRDKDSIYSEVNVFYGEDPSAEKFSKIQKTAYTSTYKHGVSKQLDVYSLHTSSTNANTLAIAIVALLDKPVISFTVPRTLFCHLPGDLIYLTRSRYFNSESTANAKLMRILLIDKGPSRGRTRIEAEEV